MPLTKEEVLKRRWKWEDEVPGTFGKETLAPEAIPDKLDEVTDSITKEILRCVSCTKNYNIVPFELSMYRKENIPIPRMCPDCRYRRRFAIRLPRRLWHRSCMCKQTNHDHRNKCSNEFETPYSPERPEKVYCESCYNKEIY